MIFKCWPHHHCLRTTAFTSLCLFSVARTTGGHMVHFPEKGITEHNTETGGSECLSSLTDVGMNLWFCKLVTPDSHNSYLYRLWLKQGKQLKQRHALLLKGKQGSNLGEKEGGGMSRPGGGRWNCGRDIMYEKNKR